MGLFLDKIYFSTESLLNNIDTKVELGLQYFTVMFLEKYTYVYGRTIRNPYFETFITIL